VTNTDSGKVMKSNLTVQL